ncbi:hypothetical protein [uncultured Nostoc sp.]
MSSLYPLNGYDLTLKWYPMDEESVPNRGKYYQLSDRHSPATMLR